ncbi:MAG: tyrosine--tRNA ligase [Eggerthellaceae bacterium]|uniref:Tyrosine--tRNA ligase n=1 Tax=Denitrobacterium detoxificans TaxID=79604 RepID=A0A172RWJ0_9ACTN|nr:tyrosine--tRNA ligase [Denitrobacterium detoxificans]ANE22111.1 tyrosyl-tRNA synthetase [Denitrobacterium detoxificans]MCR5582746.1 tyrosine--tRNA ligase [Eggerthellaceae bacterium]SEO36433.1 tyrosyl-tRNA synthetase [Denitrobacterium detoxificans]
MLPAEEQLRIIQSGVAEIVPSELLLEKLKRGVPLNVKLGVDPTAPDIHIGHAVPLRKLRTFQDLGHRVTLIIGDGTALIGDPSGRNSTRPQLTPEQVAANAQTYIDQAFKILDPEKTTLVHNADWLLKMNLEDILKVTGQFTVARILERDDFHKRYTNNLSIGVHEFLYPIMQAYDSVVIKADVELGGTDQLFNLLAGRELMEKMGMEPQVCLTLPLLEGTDGVRKMSKSYGNYIGLTDEAPDMFGKVMSIPDEMIVKYYRLASTASVDEIDEIEAGLASDSLHPNKVKRALARNIVAAYHGEEAAVAAEAEFDRVFKQHAIPEDIPEFAADLTPNDEGLVYLAKLLADAGLAKSAGEARRLIDGGGVKINGEALPAKAYNVEPAKLEGSVIQVGKRHFVKLV